MSSLTASEPKRESGSLSEKIKLIATIIGIASPILALLTFVGLKPDKTKLLEWEYISKSTLVNSSAESVDKIEVAYSGRKIKQLTAISGRLSNVGSLPIDSSDVKDGAYPEIHFPSEVISAEMKGANRNGIKASVKTSGTSVFIEHGLLNPGDSIAVSLLVEGDFPDTNALPKVNFRILGIEEPSTRYPATKVDRASVVFFSFSKPIEFIVLIAASCSFLLCIAFVAVGGDSILKQVLPSKQIRRITEGAISSFNPDQKFSFQKHLAARYFFELRSPSDKLARTLIEETPISDGESHRDFAERVAVLVRKQLTQSSFISRLLRVKVEIFAVSLFIIVTVATALVFAACWHRQLNGV